MTLVIPDPAELNPALLWAGGVLAWYAVAGVGVRLLNWAYPTFFEPRTGGDGEDMSRRGQMVVCWAFSPLIASAAGLFLAVWVAGHVASVGVVPAPWAGLFRKKDSV